MVKRFLLADRAIPPDSLTLLDDEMDLAEVLRWVGRMLGVRFTRVDYPNMDGTLDNLIRITHWKLIGEGNGQSHPVRRVGILDKAGPQAASQLWTAYRGANVWADFDEAGGLQTRYLFGLGIDSLIARTSVAGTNHGNHFVSSNPK